jgi:adenylate cyclase
VNLASRLEGQNRAYGTAILVSQTVREAAGDAFAFRLLDVVAVKGRRQGVAVHELLGATGGVPPDRVAAARLYEEAFASYRARRFDRALDVLAALEGDPAARVLAGRCRAFRDSPPGLGWDGVHTASGK